MEYLFETWCRDPRDLSFGEYLDRLYTAWDSGEPPTRLGQDVVDLYRECHRRIRADQCFALAFLGVDRFAEDWAPHRIAGRVLGVLRTTIAEVMRRRCQGHGVSAELGGANFLLLFDAQQIHPVCGDILERFDTGVATFKPSPTVSIGVGSNRERSAVVHFGQIFELAREMRAYGETQPGSVFVVDRRIEL